MHCTLDDFSKIANDDKLYRIWAPFICITIYEIKLKYLNLYGNVHVVYIIR